MPLLKAVQSRPGFQESTHSGVRVTIYQHNDFDPVILHPEGAFGKFALDGKTASDRSPSVINVKTNKVLGSASGTFSISLKPSRAAESLFDRLRDDDWVDIELMEHDRPYHVMRGLIDEIRGVKTVGSKGATTNTFTITGRDFGKIWEVTPVWFSPIAAETDLVSRTVAMEVFQDNPNNLGPPNVAVKGFLEGFLERMETDKGVNWIPPNAMPGITAASFLDSLAWNDLYQNAPKRNNFNRNYLNPSGTLWDLAMQHADMMFTELFVDVFPNGEHRDAGLPFKDPASAADTKMTVVFRDKPFPISQQTKRLIYTNKRPGGDPMLFFLSQWNTLPVVTVPRQDVQVADVGRGGIERFNAFYVTMRAIQEVIGENALTMLSPLIDTADIRRHGLRRMDVQSSCMADLQTLDDGLMAEQQRHLIRDWYCLNPYFLSGNITLKRAHPELHIGGRLRIQGSELSRGGVAKDENYYVESVSHDWTFGSPTMTSVGVTRGWIGDDESYQTALDKVAERYTVPPLVTEM